MPREELIETRRYRSNTVDVKIYNNIHFVAGWTWHSFGVGFGITRYSLSVDLGFLFFGFEW
jgi:hypothetical protein